MCIIHKGFRSFLSLFHVLILVGDWIRLKKKDDKGIELPNEDKNFENFIKKNGSINNLFTKVEEDPFKLLTA